MAKLKNAPVMLVIMDGWGNGEPQDKNNAVVQGNTPVIDRLMKECPVTRLFCSGEAVGLPDGQMGNSEVGHTNIGAGRVVYQELTRITKAIREGEFFKNEAFNAVIDETDLEEMFRRFNTDYHPLYRGYSLSVSDVVVTENGAFFCDSIGFKPIEFDETKTQKPSDMMKIVYKEPGKPAFETEIPNHYKDLSKAVKGLLETVYNGDNTIIVCNEEAKLIGMKGNIHLDNGTSIIAGPFFVCGADGEDSGDLGRCQEGREGHAHGNVGDKDVPSLEELFRSYDRRNGKERRKRTPDPEPARPVRKKSKGINR